MEYLACYVTIYNRSSRSLENGQPVAEWGKYTALPDTRIPPGGWTTLTIMGRENSPSGCDGTCTYNVTSEAGMGAVRFQYSCPMRGSNQASARNDAVGVKVKVYAEISTRQRIGPPGSTGNGWDTGEKNWGREGSIPADGHPLSALFVVEDAEQDKGAPLPVQARILSYNTHLFHDTVAGLRVSFDETLRMAGIAERIVATGADVVGLSEVWSDDVKESIITSLTGAYPYSYYHRNQQLVKLESGLLLLSRHPLSDCSYTPYTTLVSNDGFTEKGFYTARVSIATPAGAASMFVALTHTQSGSTPREVQVRTSNIEELARAVGRLPYGDGTVVVLGDLNICAEVDGQPQDEYERLKELLAPYGLQDVCRLVYPSAARDPMYTYDWFTNAMAKRFAPDEKVSQRLDYIFARGLGADPAANTRFDTFTDWKYQSPSAGVNDLSDHYPLRVTINAGR